MSRAEADALGHTMSRAEAAHADAAAGLLALGLSNSMNTRTAPQAVDGMHKQNKKRGVHLDKDAHRNDMRIRMAERRKTLRQALGQTAATRKRGDRHLDRHLDKGDRHLDKDAHRKDMRRRTAERRNGMYYWTQMRAIIEHNRTISHELEVATATVAGKQQELRVANATLDCIAHVAEEKKKCEG